MILRKDAFDFFIYLVAYVALFHNNRVPLLMQTSVLFIMYFCLLHFSRIFHLKFKFKLQPFVFSFCMLKVYRFDPLGVK